MIELKGKPNDRSIPFFKEKKEKKAHNLRRLPRKPINPVSPKRAVENKLYALAKKKWKQDLQDKGEWRCEFALDGARCPKRPDSSPHHAKRRGRHLCDISTFRALCSEHHHWVHFVDPAKAEEMGLLIREYEKHNNLEESS